jgi:hypothetical protein
MKIMVLLFILLVQRPTVKTSVPEALMAGDVARER